MAKAVALVGVLVFGMLALGGISTQYQDTVRESQPHQEITNESVTISKGTVHELAESKRDVVYNKSVRVEQNGTVYADSEYQWYGGAGNGTLFVPSDSSLGDGEANVTYDYSEPSGVQRTTRDITLIPFQLGEGLGIIVGAAFLLGGLAVMGRLR